MKQSFKEIFFNATGKDQPYDYQTRLACGQTTDLTSGTLCQSQLIDIPTGLGKTAAVVMAWVWNRLRQPNEEACKQWPRRLVYCLPMRTLVEQTRDDVQKWISNLRLNIGIYILMGGEDAENWDIYPEKEAILIGTQDMLLSRALNRGYGMSRYRWPMHFALLNNDSLWVLDETQLMGVGVETSAQLDAFRHSIPVFASSHTWWMSATLLETQLQTVDHPKPESGWPKTALSIDERQNERVVQRIEAQKPIQKFTTVLSSATKNSYSKTLATFINQNHRADTLTLVIMNRVDRAQDVYKEVLKLRKNSSEGLALIHSRFRPKDRQRNTELLKGEKRKDRIVIATQAVEAGVDVSARLLITELAPWSSLVQRFGRCNRYGEQNGSAEIVWVDIQPKDEKDSLLLPYNLNAFQSARGEIEKLENASPAMLGTITVETKPLIRPVIRRKDLTDLFDTTPDLCGQDLDISRYIRDDSDETDVQVFWRTFEEKPEDESKPQREELCRVGVHSFKDFKKKAKESGIWIWNLLEGCWQAAEQLFPGAVYLVNSSLGGYSEDLGWTGNAQDILTVLKSKGKDENDQYSKNPLTFDSHWQNIQDHSADVIRALKEITTGLDLESHILKAEEMAALWHDIGKAHPVFQTMFARGAGPWAKSEGKGCPPKRDGQIVKGFRHELASALAWLQVGPKDQPDRDLVAYLIAAHHGKVRLSIRSLPDETPTPNDASKLFARGVWDGDSLPAVPLAELTTPLVTLDLSLMNMGTGPSGPSWLSRMITLRDKIGLFRLAYYEALLRAADWRASANEGAKYE